MVGQRTGQEAQGVELGHLGDAGLVDHDVLRPFQAVRLQVLDGQLARGQRAGRRKQRRAAVARGVRGRQVIGAGGRRRKTADGATVGHGLGLVDKIDRQQHRQAQTQLGVRLGHIAVEIRAGLAGIAGLAALPRVVAQGKCRGDGIALDGIRRAPHHQHGLDAGFQLGVDTLLELGELVHAQLAGPVRDSDVGDIGGGNAVHLPVVFAHFDAVGFGVVDDDGQLRRLQAGGRGRRIGTGLAAQGSGGRRQCQTKKGTQ